MKIALILTALSFASFANAQSFGRPGAGAPATSAPIVSDKTKMPMNKANIEDITNENYPDLIESFDYPNADILDVVKAVSELTGKNFIVDPQVRGKITIIAPSQITVAEAYKAFLSALAINGYTVVPSGNFLKVKSARNAQRDSIETYSGNYYPDADQMITRIIKLKYISADEVNKNLRILPSKDGEMVPYPPTNSIIISDYGSNIDRVMKIIEQLDVPGFEERLEVIRMKFAAAKTMADLINQIINKGQKNQPGFTPGIPRFRSGQPGDSGGSGAESFSLVLPDDRTNSIIVVGNQAGIAKIKSLVSKLDFRLRPDELGGVYVYHVRHGEAEKLANTLNGIATESKKALDQQNQPGGMGAIPRPGADATAGSAAAIFGGDVKFAADKNSNSLIITASKGDYEIILNLLRKIDNPRDQVYVKTIIMEMNMSNGTSWGVNYYKFDANSQGIGRIGISTGKLDDILNPANDAGAILGFGSGQVFDMKTAAGTVKVSSLMGFIKFLKTTTNANVLSTPAITALDNEDATIEVGEEVPVGKTTTQTGTAPSQTSIERKDATIKLDITPHISPDTDVVQMKIDQKIQQISNTKVQAAELASAAIVLTKRAIKTNIVVNSGDTAVLGGLMRDEDTEEVTKVPLLGDIPILGWLFKGKKTDKRKTNLVVFITPKVIRNVEDNASIVNQNINDRIDFIQRSAGGRDPYGETIDNLPRKRSTEAPEEKVEEPATETF